MWYFNLNLIHGTTVIRNGARITATKEGAFIVYPCGAKRYVKNGWYDEEYPTDEKILPEPVEKITL